MRVFIAAVQAAIEPQVYQSPEAFAARVDAIVTRALENAPPGPRVVAFPELFALPLVLWLEAPSEVLRASRLQDAALTWLRTLGVAKALRKGPWGLYHLRAPAVWRAWTQAFEYAARRHQAYLFAGTAFLPRLDDEPARGLHAVGNAVYNWGYWVSPRGRILARPEKLRLTAEERRALLRPGAWGGQVARTRLGTLGTLICLDAFHEALVERVDASGAWLLVQPSANARAWEGPWSADPSEVEGEVWLRTGLKAKLADRENLRYGLNPMLTGSLYELGFEGRANVAEANGLLSITPSPVGDGVATALVELF